MQRRTFLASTVAALAAPAIARGAAASTLKFVPQADLAVLDPIWTTTYQTRDHGFLVFDTLFGLDSNYRPQPQMAAGATTEDGGKTWRITLRPELMFHDGTKVLARDCAASIKRWGARDGFGQALMAATDEISAPDDTTILFRLKAPFPLLPDALGKTPPSMCPIMPERLAATDPYKQVTEMVGSGPYRYKADERVPGSLVVYERNPHYVPRPGGMPEGTAGPKVAHIERIEWHIIPDPATVAGALQTGEIDWWLVPQADLLPVLRPQGGLKVVNIVPTGFIATLRCNQLNPPFDNPAIRRALLGAVDQAEAMTTIAGDDKNNWRDGIGLFGTGSPLASDIGVEVLKSPRDYAQVKQALTAAGYKGEKIIVMAPTDVRELGDLTRTGAEQLRRAGMNVDLQEFDFGNVIRRRSNQGPPDKGGYNVFCTLIDRSLPNVHPLGNLAIRADGKEPISGWANSPKIEELRAAWLDTEDLEQQKKICEELQKHLWQDVPFIPLGEYWQASAYRKRLVDIIPGCFATFYGVRPA
jgi:peptide/nickel transport system substrate-binding protein